MREAESFLPLHPLEFRILLELLEGPSHGYEIVRSIEAEGGCGRVYPANLYRRIRDLLTSELIEEIDVESDDVAHARRRYVRVMRLGRSVARAEARRLRAVVQDSRVNALLQTTR
jgi:DNA-binding PadR family transcriptional regulator